MSRRRAHFVLACAAGTIFLLLLAVVGGQDYRDAQRDEAQYCADIKAGVYPDYRNLRKECNNHETTSGH